MSDVSTTVDPVETAPATRAIPASPTSASDALEPLASTSAPATLPAPGTTGGQALESSPGPDVSRQALAESDVPPVAPGQAVDNPPADVAPLSPEPGDPAVASGSNADAQAVPSDAADPAVEANKIGFDLRFIDIAGRPIAGLQHKVILTEEGKRLEFPATSDPQGRGPSMSGMEPATPLEIWIRKDDGTYVMKYKGSVGCRDTSLCMVSPHIKIPVGTEIHAGSPGTLPPKALAGDPSVERRPNAPTSQAMGGKLPDPGLAPQRDAKGNPVATATTPSKDANDKNRLPTLGLFSWGNSGNAGATATTPQKVAASASGVRVDPAKVAELIKTMEQQVTWDWVKLKATYGTSGGIKIAMTAKTFNYSPDTKDAARFGGQCYSSVKVGLWRAGLVEGVEGGVYPSTMARKWLLDQGFVEVTAQVPDARWAAPGDLITYRYDDVTLAANNAKIASALKQYDADMKDFPAKQRACEEAHQAWQQRRIAPSLAQLPSATSPPARKAAKVKDPEPRPPKAPEQPLGENYGHIDVRGYDGYFSDAKATKLPSAAAHGSVKGFVVNGIFRKVCDDQPDLRVRAFLKCLREWECHEEADDSKRYFLMLTAIDGSRRFTDTSTHPQEGVNTRNTAAGAYQFTLETYQRLSSPAFGIGPGFSPAFQDRFAVAYLEILPSSPLAFIRSGDIAKAVQLLTPTWSSLPGGKQPRTEMKGKTSHVYTMDDFTQRHVSFMQELKGA